jgi:SRSO17 transposase
LKLIDEYCRYYRNLFSEVRSFEAFTHLHAGIISDIKRKTLPAIAEIMGLENAQGLHHFLTQSPWEAQALRRQRLELILRIVKDLKIVIIIDETGGPKKGKATDYVARQYLGRLGKIDNGIVAVVSYGLVDGLTFPLTFEIYKPKERLKLKDSYLSKPQIARQMIREIKAMGFEIDCVLADSLYGESTSTFIRCATRIKSSICALRFGVITVCGCFQSKGLELINGVNLSGYFPMGTEKSAIFEKLFMEKREHCVTGKSQQI